jgi:hypothetical protein
MLAFDAALTPELTIISVRYCAVALHLDPFCLAAGIPTFKPFTSLSFPTCQVADFTHAC